MRTLAGLPVRKLAFLLASAIVSGCGPRPLPPLMEAAVPVTEASNCHGLDRDFRWSAIRVGGDKADEYYRMRWGYRFLNMFGPVGHPDLNYKTPTYAKAVFEPSGSALRIVIHGDVGSKLAEIRFPNVHLLECGPKQSRVSLEYEFSSAEAGATRKRLTITLASTGDVTRIHTRVEAEHAWLVFRSAKQWAYWGDFEYHRPAN